MFYVNTIVLNSICILFHFSIVQSKQTFMTTIEFLPRKAGVKDLVVSFNSKELAMVDGSCEITISA